MAETIKTLLLNQLAELIYSCDKIASVYLNPSCYEDFANSLGLGPCCVIVDKDENPKTENEVRKTTFTVQLEIYIKSNPTPQDNGRGIFVSQADKDLEAIYGEINTTLLAPGNALFQYVKKVEEKQKSKFLGYDENSILVNLYELTYFTCRNNPYLMIDGIGRPSIPPPVIIYNIDGGNA